MTVTCPHCHTEIVVALNPVTVDPAGIVVTCPGCGRRYRFTVMVERMPVGEGE